MKLTSSLIFLMVLIASGFCDDPVTTVNPTTEAPKSSVQTATPSPSTTVPPTSQQPNTTTPSPSTTVPPTSQQPNTTTSSPSTTVPTTSQQPNTTTSSPSTTVPTTSQQPNTTTVSPSTTVPTTSLQPNTTTPSSTTVPTTSQQPNTTIPSPSTASTNPSTTSSTESPTSTTNTTSVKPTTSSPQPTTGPPVTSTKSPEPPTPVDGSWNVTEGNLTCIRADLKIRFKIPVKEHAEYVILSPNATSSGNCLLSNTTQELKLEEPGYTLTMIFEKDSDNAYLKNVTFAYTLPDSSGFVYYDTKLFSVQLGNSHKCDSLSNINLKNVTMEVFHIHIRSFGNVGDKDFGTAESCQGDIKVDPMIPPAVGIVLLTLVIVVLVGYFLERRRSRQRGYRNV